MTEPWTADMLAVKGYTQQGETWVKETPVSSSGERAQRAGKVGEPRTKDAAKRNNVKSGDRTQRATNESPYDSKLEAAYAQFLELEQRAGNIASWLHHPFTFRLSSGKRYTVDFVTWGYDGSTYCIEIKGWHANRRDSLTHLAWASQRFPFHKWLLVTRNKQGGWDEQLIKP